jgi:hypothetical protein
MKTKTKNKRNKHNLFNKTKKVTIPSSTPLKIRRISDNIAGNIERNNVLFFSKRKTGIHSYSPTINQKLISLKSIPRSEIIDCNNKSAFELKEPLKINVRGKCYNYYEPQALQFLLKNLAANKHINPKKIVPPIQAQSNCWFNAMFVTFFVSDKGRKFFHFFRQLMIEGKQKDGSIIPNNLTNAFSLLNFAVEACLTGNKYAYELNTNSIIGDIYKNIPPSYKKQHSIIVDVGNAGNPLEYYISIINYLNNNSILLMLVEDSDSSWREKIIHMTKGTTHLPHIIVLEVYDDKAITFNKKPRSFMVNEAKYILDSSVVRDTTGQHFSATITCEGEQMGYDGMSFHRLVPLTWKDKLNKDFTWEFEGSNDLDETPLRWNYMKSYQLLMYYRS